jgi:energy-coupling factor transporter ATP-binding protein EcfA2
MNNKIVVKNVCKTFNFFAGKTVQKNVALDNVSFEVEKGTCTVLAGENGSGKSLLMSIIAGLEKCNSGFVEVFGKVGIVFQEAETQILGDTVKDDVAFGLKNQKLKKEEINKKIEENNTNLHLENAVYHDGKGNVTGVNSSKLLNLKCIGEIEGQKVYFMTYK